MTINTAARLVDKHDNRCVSFIRLPVNGDKVVGAFCGEPFASMIVWTGERYETYDPVVHTDTWPRLCVMINFYVPIEGTMRVLEVIEVNANWLRNILNIRDKYDPDKWLFEIERHGDAVDPETTCSILPKEKLDDAMRTRIAAAQAHDLAALSMRGACPDS